MTESERHSDHKTTTYNGTERRRAIKELDDDIGFIRRNWKAIGWTITAAVTLLASYFTTKNAMANLLAAQTKLESVQVETRKIVDTNSTEIAVIKEAISDIRDDSKETKRDIKEILRLMK